MKIDFNKYTLLIPSLAISIMLFLAIPNLFPYSYYWGVRWIVTAGSIFIVYQAYRNKHIILLFLFASTSVIFNPIFPIQFNKKLWRVFDFLAGILFVISIWVFTKERRMENDRKSDELTGSYKKKSLSIKTILLIVIVALTILSAIIIVTKLNSGLSHEKAKDILVKNWEKVSDKKIEAISVLGIKKISAERYWVKINYAYFHKMLPDIDGKPDSRNFFVGEDTESIAKKEGKELETLLFDNNEEDYIFNKWDTGWTFEKKDSRKFYSPDKFVFDSKIELTPQEAKKIFIDIWGKKWAVKFDIVNVKEIKKLVNDNYWVRIFFSYVSKESKEIENDERDYLYAKFDTGWFTDTLRSLSSEQMIKEYEEKNKQSEKQSEESN